MIKIRSNNVDFTTKYIIEAKFKIKGVVEKSDIVGVIFGQTEGLLLDLDLRDLQKSGRIGRIEVENESKEGISEGIIKIPSSLTRKETALLAATIETVSRVGPCEAEIQLIEIRDVREAKRKQIIERAAELLKEWDEKSLEPSEIEEQIDTDIKLGEIISWGPEGLPAGPNIDSSSELILVEGRADVLNLLRIGVKNTVAVQGTQVPKSIISLTKKKESVIAFLDGDRGGTIILNELLQVAKVIERKEHTGKESRLQKLLKKLKVKNYSTIEESFEKIEPGHSIGFNKSLEKLFEIPVGEIFEKIKDFKGTQFLIIDGILTKRLLSLLLKLKLKFIACKNKEEDLRIPEQIIVFFF